MKRLNNVLWAFAALAAISVSTASAQATSPATEKFFFNANFGVQIGDQSLTTTASQTVYDELATLTASQPVSGSAIFDFGGGYRIWGDVYAGVVVSFYGDTEVASTTASIPDPLFFNRPRTVTGSQTGLKRSEVAVSPNVTWAKPLMDKVDIAIGLGVAIIHLDQDLVGSFTVPPPTQNVDLHTVSETGTGVGIYAAADIIYNLNPRYGVGGFVRYAGSSVDLPSADNTDVGGVQVGGGIRLKF